MEKDGKQKGKVEEDGDVLGSSSTSSSSFSSSFSDGNGDCNIRARTINRKKLRKSHCSLEKKEKEKKDKNDGILQDPLVVLGSDIMLKILSRLDAHSVALCLLVSRGWRGVASTDSIWSTKCGELWLGKAHIPRISKVHGLSKMKAYSLSVKDGKRTRIMKEDLCDHVWEFHFTEVAPEYWQSLDPFWNDTGSPMRRYFHPDGSHTADPGDKVWGGHESCYSVVTSLSSDGRIREHYVRINRWPPLSVARKQDWRWELRNKLHIYSTIHDPQKEDGTGPLYPIF